MMSEETKEAAPVFDWVVDRADSDAKLCNLLTSLDRDRYEIVQLDLKERAVVARKLLPRKLQAH